MTYLKTKFGTATKKVAQFERSQQSLAELNFDFNPQKHGVNLLHIESRSSKRHEASYDFFVEMDTRGTGDVNGALEEIKSDATHFNVISREYKDNAGVKR